MFKKFERGSVSSKDRQRSSLKSNEQGALAHNKWIQARSLLAAITIKNIFSVKQSVKGSLATVCGTGGVSSEDGEWSKVSELCVFDVDATHVHPLYKSCLPKHLQDWKFPGMASLMWGYHRVNFPSNERRRKGEWGKPRGGKKN